MIIVATLKEIKDIINNLNYADNTEVTLTVDADTDMWHNGAVQADEDTVTQPNIGSLERGFVNQFQNIEDLYTIAKDCLEVAAPYEWERDLKKGYLHDLCRLNSTALGKAIREYAAVDGVPNWNKTNELMTKFLEDNLENIK